MRHGTWLPSLLLSVSISVGVDVPATQTAPAPPGATPAPAMPKGFASADAVKQAIKRGKVALINPYPPVPDGVKLTEGIEYGRVGEHALKLDLYRPAAATGRVPGVILIHGGGWKGGNRAIYRFYCVALAEKGYAAATMSYRFSTVAPFPAALQDTKCAVRWMRANAAKYGIDPDRIAVAGGSAGGHLAMMVGYTPGVPELEGDGGNPGVSSRVQAVIDLYGPTDLTTEFARRQGVVVQFMGGKPYEEAEALYKQASPMTHVTRDAPPTLILHGTVDDIVPVEQADALAKRLKDLGAPFHYVRFEGWPHTMDLAEAVNKRCLWEIEQFLARHLGAAGRLSR